MRGTTFRLFRVCVCVCGCVCVCVHACVCVCMAQYSTKKRNRDSAVGIATRYELDGPGIESRWGRGFQHLSRQALRPIQPPI